MTDIVSAELDVSLMTTPVCVVDPDGAVVFEAKVESVAGIIVKVLSAYRGRLEVVGLEDCRCRYG